MKALRNWLGTERTRALIGLLIATGIGSTILQSAFPDASWLGRVQTALVLAFLGGTVIIVGSAMEPTNRNRLYFRGLPAVGVLALSIILPNFLPLFMGIALGWVLVAGVLLRNNEQREYKLAVKALRKNDYKAGIHQMSDLIQREPNIAQHYGFRAQLYRLDNQPSRAQADYEKVVALDPDSALGANGLAELFLQQDQLEDALHWAETAYKKAKDDWVAVYNLGMILERRGENKRAAKLLNEALALKIPDSRHRLLTRLWLARIYYRQGKHDDADDMIRVMHKEQKGLKEWRIILESDEATSLRQLLQDDVRQAEKLMNDATMESVFNAER